MNTNMRPIDADAPLPHGLTKEDFAALTHYPTLAKLFDAPNRHDVEAMKAKLNQTFQTLERVIVRGSKEDSARAQTAAAAIRNTLDFIEMLEQSQQNG